MGFTVKMADGSDYVVNTLLGKGDSNVKLMKSDKANKGFLTVGLSLSPANESGYQTCASSSAGCRQACLFTAGHGIYPNVKRARIAKTRFFFQDSDSFLRMLRSELVAARKRAVRQGKLLACRLNVVSDIMWESVAPELFTEFHDVQFYDYTKHYKRAVRYYQARSTEIHGSLANNQHFPANYHLTFSCSESNGEDVSFLCKWGIGLNIAVVFDSKVLPATWGGRSVVNGDETDLRFLDKSGVIVGLYAKGRGRKDNSGFVVNVKRVPLEVLNV